MVDKIMVPDQALKWFSNIHLFLSLLLNPKIFTPIRALPAARAIRSYACRHYAHWPVSTAIPNAGCGR
ncbi:hypothetical protein FHS10_000551 [Mucilaginibacter dorajii]|uniref:hypothetical protein n=1 Tax=Mucilaginibacter dorajii TaxID=692994 RepID=UPI002169E6BC|nr:hypothetical protein [Mucilaginibacter dorajii]MCS3732623.1 hypothetical protein [Mucilaginibacter dorajii]